MNKARWLKDWQFGAAFLAAPVVWGFLYWKDSPQLSLWWLQIPGTFLMLVLIQPLLEEVVFRGLLQGWCSNQAWGTKGVVGITFANLVTSTIFTALHFISHAPLMAALVFVPSLLFGYFRDRYEGWLVASIVLHCFYNAGYFLIYKPL